ncbi:MAG: lipid-A-disaccharide synthase [Arenimonas sp.]
MKIALIAGEESGDLLAAELMAALKARQPGIQFIGMGGPKMQAQGLDSWFDYKTLSVMGFIEVLKHLPALLKLRKNLLKRIVAEKPDLVIGVDAPDFNLGIEKSCKRAGLRTVHFVSPSVWAWREKRAARIAESCEQVLCLFPMEPAIYAKYGVDARFVGHPLADRIAMTPDRETARTALALPDCRHLAILPGSRVSEIDRLLPVFLQGAAILKASMPEVHFLIPAANSLCRDRIAHHLQSHPLPDTRILDGHAQPAMIAADAVLLASGTAALEAMLCKRPMVVAYRISAITYAMVNALGLIKIERFSLPNVLSGQDLVPELIQDRCTPEAIAGELQSLLEAKDNTTLMAHFERLHSDLRRNAGDAAASAVLELLAKQ